MDIVYSVLSFMITIGVLVTVHEFGHYWVARRLGVKVLRFSIGFGHPLWRYQAGPDKTEYVIAAMPLGGYVKMLDEREEEVAVADLPRAFNRQKLSVRFAIVLAGPLFNFLFAVIAYWVMFMLGVSGVKPLVAEVAPDSAAARAGFVPGYEIQRVEDQETRTWEAVVQSVLGSALHQDTFAIEVKDREGNRRQLQLVLTGTTLDDLAQGQFFDSLGITPAQPKLPPIIGKVERGGPAAQAGLVPGDRILSANSEPIEDWVSWVEYVRSHPQQTIAVRLDRQGTAITLILVPDTDVTAEGTIGRIGAWVQSPTEETPDNLYITERHSPAIALGQALGKTYEVSLLTLQMFWKMLMLEVSLEHLSGPISIAQYAGSSARNGMSRFLQFLGIVSISLGILNLLPIPVLDGGHLLYYCIELCKGKPLSERAQIIGQRLGLAMLFGLMSLAFYNDIARLLG